MFISSFWVDYSPPQRKWQVELSNAMYIFVSFKIALCDSNILDLWKSLSYWMHLIKSPPIYKI